MTNGLVAGKYRVLRRIAEGGMGEICLAAQVGPAGFERAVALKRMLAGLTDDASVHELFLDEARLIALLSHRNICQIIELGEDEGGYFVAMELVTGGSVLDLCKKVVATTRNQLDPFFAVDIAAQVAEALAYAYSTPGPDGQPLRIIHRDVTPHNILLSTSGDVKLIDFGVAKSSVQKHATEMGLVKGKLAYLSPEQSRGQPLDARSDLFALGVVLYEMITGSKPFERDNPGSTMQAIQRDDLPNLGSVYPSWAPLDPVLAKLTAKNKEDRYPDANVAAEALLDLRQALPRPRKRLGPYVAEVFEKEVFELAQFIALSKSELGRVDTLIRHDSKPGLEGTQPSARPATVPPAVKLPPPVRMASRASMPALPRDPGKYTPPPSLDSQPTIQVAPGEDSLSAKAGLTRDPAPLSETRSKPPEKRRQTAAISRVNPAPRPAVVEDDDERTIDTKKGYDPGPDALQGIHDAPAPPPEKPAPPAWLTAAVIGLSVVVVFLLVYVYQQITAPAVRLAPITAPVHLDTKSGK